MWFRKKETPFPKPRHQYDKRIIQDIENVGWSVVLIEEDETTPPYAFSVGMYHSHQHPEIAILGMDPLKAGQLINQMGAMVILDQTIETDTLNKEFMNVGVVFKTISPKHYEEFFGTAAWLYQGDNFPMLQCVWPLRTGHFPWDEGYPEEGAAFQPFLGETRSGPAGETQDPVEMFQNMLSAAESDPDAAFAASKAYSEGQVVEKDEEEAHRWMLKAATGGHPIANFLIGRSYQDGEFGDPDYGKAMQHYEAAVESGFPVGLSCIGELHMKGLGVEENPEEGFRWFEKGAETGHPVCQAELGECFEKGRGTEIDLEKALELYKASLEQGFDPVAAAIERVQASLQ